MATQLRKLLWLLDAKARRNGAILLVLMLIGALLEVVGVAAVPAFISAVLEPERLREIPGASGLIDALGLKDPGDFVIWGSLALVAVFAIKNGFLLMNFYLQSRYVANQRMALSHRMAEIYLRAPYHFHLHRNTAEIIRNINREVNVVSGQLIGSILEVFTRLFILVAVLAFLFAVEPIVTLYWFGFFGAVAAVGMLLVSGRLKEYGQMEQIEGRRLVQWLNQAFGGLKEMKILHRETFFAGKISQSVETTARVGRYKMFVGKAITPSIEFAAVVGLLALSSWLVLSGRPSDSIIFTLSLFVVALVRLREALTAVIYQFTGLRYNLVSVDPLYAELHALGSSENQEAIVQNPVPNKFSKQIELRDIWYRYTGGADHSLKGINISIPKGSAVGFVGSTGAGKSTLVDTILALLEPESGGVFVDGVDIRQSGIKAWQATVGYVPQSIYLLDDTIKRNIAYGIADNDIDETALRRAIATSQLDRLIKNQPNGMDTRVGERGVRLSGGERQRIGIARALYRNPQVLIFDEATSALDNNTERAIIAAVEALKGERTIIMIAHRLTTVQNSDVLYFLKDGRIEASGSFAELRENHEDFRMMAVE